MSCAQLISVDHTTMTAMRQPRRCAPKGVVTGKPIWTRLLPNERACFDALNAQEGYSDSELGRRLMLPGLREAAALAGLAYLLEVQRES
ncbi:hypothetical protein [Chitiniphilus shinanonensis]|uniref:hypothetical protein n=1 Tax=Chitiniphilus shinanonensis TaxID=553088 RepID=UPI0030476740